MAIADLRAARAAELIRRHRLIAILRRVEPRNRLTGLVAQLRAAGVAIFELTMDGADAPADLAAVRRLLDDVGDGDCLLGAGTIRDRGQLEAALASGADFGVSPVLDPEVLSAALQAGLPFIPGAYSPTEAATAWRQGATFVKLFPASSLGIAFVRELRGPLGDIELIPTGGIDAAGARAFLAAGAVAVGVGSALVRADDAGRRAIVDAVRGSA